MANIKKLTPTVLKKAEKNLDKKGEMTLSLDGEKYKLEYDLVFRKTKHQNIVRGVIDFLSLSTEREGYADYVSPYVSLLVLKEFTSLEVPDDMDEAFVLLGVLVDTKLLPAILTALPEDQLIEVFDTVGEAVNELTEQILELEDEREGLENPELLEQIERTEDAEIEAEVEEEILESIEKDDEDSE